MSIKPVGPQPVLVEGVPVLYGDGRTKQAFKDETDINRIIARAQRAGTLSHLVRHGASYGDFSDVPDLLAAHERLQNGKAIYDELPSELRKEFPDMFKFFEYVNDPENAGALQEKLPGLAKPGLQNPDVRRSGASEVNPAIDSRSVAERQAEGQGSAEAPVAPVESAEAAPASS